MYQQPTVQQQQELAIAIVLQGRVVWGDMKPRNKKIFGTQQDMIDQKTGKPVIEYAFGLAIPKVSQQSNQHEVENFQKFWNAVHTVAAKLGYQQGDQRFAWKFIDGDGKKEDGSEYPKHSKGCYVLACSTRIPLKIMAWEGQQIVQITDDQIKTGDYVQVQLTIDGHGNPNAGLYINPSYVARFAYGEAIVNAPDPVTIFGAAPPPMPFGASSTPVGSGPVGQFGAPSMGQAQQPFGGAGNQPQTVPQGMGGPQAPAYQPNFNPLPQQFQPQAQQQPMQGMPGMGAAPQQQPQQYNNGQPNASVPTSQMYGPHSGGQPYGGGQQFYQPTPQGAGGPASQGTQQIPGMMPQQPIGPWQPPQ